MPNIYPLQVEVNEENILKITDTFKQAYKDIVGEISGATDFGVANRRAILGQIESTLEDLGVDVQQFLENELPGYYKIGADDAVTQLTNIGAPVQVKEGFNRVHKDAIFALVDETAKAFGESLSGVNRSAQTLLGKAVREQLTQKIATGLVGGDALREVRKQIKGTLQEQGLEALVDKGGRKWELDRYAEMLFRTKAVEARNRGLVNRMVENGYDLVQVSAHFGSCKLCAPWQGKILSISGKEKGYPTVLQAEKSGLFHPNCRHAINALVPSLAKKTRAYDPNTKTVTDPGLSIRKPIEEQTEARLIGPANKHYDLFNQKVEALAAAGSWEFGIGPVKKLERSVDKILYDYNGTITELRDVLRSVVFINDPNDEAEFNQIVEATRKEFGNVERVKVGLNRTKGYKNNMINVKTKGGVIAEIQVTTVEMWEAKKDLGGDALYHKVREQVDGFEKYEKQMLNLYRQAEQKTKARLAQAKV